MSPIAIHRRGFVNSLFNQLSQSAQTNGYAFPLVRSECSRMKISSLSVIVLPLLAAALIDGGAGARAAASHEYVIAANDGYGLADCLAEGSDCGQVVADAWCEAHGHGHALTFGPRAAADGRPTQVSTADEPYVIQCGD
jgi:hypothetical protein